MLLLLITQAERNFLMQTARDKVKLENKVDEKLHEMNNTLKQLVSSWHGLSKVGSHLLLTIGKRLHVQKSTRNDAKKHADSTETDLQTWKT